MKTKRSMVWALMMTQVFVVSTSCDANLDDAAETAATETVQEDKEPLYVASTKVWDSGDIKVCRENATTANAAGRGWVADAVTNTWEEAAAIDFTGWASGACPVGRIFEFALKIPPPGRIRIISVRTLTGT